METTNTGITSEAIARADAQLMQDAVRARLIARAANRGIQLIRADFQLDQGEWFIDGRPAAEWIEEN